MPIALLLQVEEAQSPWIQVRNLLFFSIIVNIFMQYVMTGRLWELAQKTVTGKQMYPAHII